MTIELFLYAMFASFLFIGIKSWQNQNVIFKNWFWIFPSAIALAFCEVRIVGLIAIETQKAGLGADIWVPIGIGSALGCYISMFLHSKFLSKDQDN